MSGNTEKVDILNREDFINRAVQLVNMISANKGNMTFAINGEWGCGKTFVLEEIEKRLSEDTSKKYLVIPYNCWQYDYYEEPLVAIVSALQSFADSGKKVSAETKEKLKAVASRTIFSLATQFAKNKTGIDLSELKSDLKAGSEAVGKLHEYDEFYGFKEVLNSIKNELKEIADEYSLIFAVDELDRCLPEYAIKVLERLHHVTEDLPNTITIIAIDKTRLSHTVESIFGEKSADEYLKKFIRFELKLDKGEQDGKKFFEKFPEFYNRFDASLYSELYNTEQFLEELFSDIDARSQEQIVEKATLFNDICFGDEKQDHSIMYMVLFLATLHYYYNEKSIFSNDKIIADHKDVFSNYSTMPKAFRSNRSGFVIKNQIHRDFNNYTIPVDANVFMVVLFYWYHVPENTGIPRDNTYIPRLGECSNSRLHDNLVKLRDNIELLKIIS